MQPLRLLRNVAFPRLRIAVIAFLAVAAGCAQQPVRSAGGTPVAAASTPTQTALQAVSPQLLHRARAHGYQPKLLFCRDSGSSGACQYSREPGYRPVLFFCKQETPTGSYLSTTHCIDVDHLSLTLQEEDTVARPPDMTIN
jgi:hypothetical protein